MTSSDLVVRIVMEGTPSKVIRGVLRGKVKMQIDTPLVPPAV